MRQRSERIAIHQSYIFSVTLTDRRLNPLEHALLMEVFIGIDIFLDGFYIPFCLFRRDIIIE